MDTIVMDRTVSSEPLLTSGSDGCIDENEDLPLDISELNHDGHVPGKQHPVFALLTGKSSRILMMAVMIEFLQTFDKSGT
jgi:hypothetical protein